MRPEPAQGFNHTLVVLLALALVVAKLRSPRAQRTCDHRCRKHEGASGRRRRLHSRFSASVCASYVVGLPCVCRAGAACASGLGRAQRGGAFGAARGVVWWAWAHPGGGRVAEWSSGGATLRGGSPRALGRCCSCTTKAANHGWDQLNRGRPGLLAFLCLPGPHAPACFIIVPAAVGGPSC